MTTTRLAADAKNRAARSFLQGFGIDIAVAVAMALLAWLPDADVSKKEAWLILGTSLVKTVLQAGAIDVGTAVVIGLLVLLLLILLGVFR